MSDEDDKRKAEEAARLAAEELARKKIKEEADAKEQKDAAERARKLVGDSAETSQFPIWKMITDQFTRRATGDTDWMKIGITGVGAVLGGAMAGQTGILGMGVSALLGAGLAGTVGVFLMDFLRGESGSKVKPIPRGVDRPFAGQANELVIARSQSVFPEVPALKATKLTVTIPTYDKTQNPAALASRAEIERLRAIAGKGIDDSRYAIDANNYYLRSYVRQLEKSANSNELNLRYLKDEFPKALQAPAEEVEKYLAQYGEEARASLSVKLDPIMTPKLAEKGLKMDDVPGQQGKLTDELDAYGREIKAKLIAEMAQIRGVSADSLPLEEKAVMFDKAWDNLNVIAKRNLITNFANRAIFDALSQPGNMLSYFPEENYSLDRLMGASDFATAAKKQFSIDSGNGDVFYRPNVLLRPATFLGERLGLTTRSPGDKFYDAYREGNLEEMAKLLEARLAKDDTERADGNPTKKIHLLSEKSRSEMKTYIMGFRAHDKNLALDRFIQTDLIPKQLPALEQYENGLNAHAWKVDRVRKRIAAFEQGGKKFLVLDEGTIDGQEQTLKLLDTRDDKRKSVKVEIAYEAAPVSGKPRTIKSIKINGEDRTVGLKNKVLPAGDIARMVGLEQILEDPAIYAVAASERAPTAFDLAASERGASPLLTYTDATTTPASAPVWSMPPADPALSDKEPKR